MKYTEAKFNRRYKVGEFEHEDYTLTAILEDGDKADKILIGMKADVTAAFSGEEAPAQEPKKTAKKTGSKKTPDPEPEAEDEDEIPEDPEDEEEESEEEEEEEQEEKPAKDKKKFKKN